MTTCELIDKILKEKNWSRRKLAIKAEIPPSSLQSAMQRNTTLSVDMLVKIANALKVDIYELLTGETQEIYFQAEVDTIMRAIKDGYSFSDKETELVSVFNTLNSDGQQMIIDVTKSVVRISQQEQTETPPEE